MGSGGADLSGGTSAEGSADMGVEGTKPKFGFKMPKIGFGGKKDVSGDIDVKADLPSANIDVSGDADMSGGADLSGGISADGSADIDVEGTKPRFGFKMPKIGFGGGKDAKVSIEGPSVDVAGEADVSGDVKMPDITSAGKGTIGLPEGTMEVDTPDASVGLDGNVKADG